MYCIILFVTSSYKFQMIGISYLVAGILTYD